MAHLSSRRADFRKPLDHRIAGSLIAGVIIFVVLLCLHLCLFYFQRTKANKKRKATALRLGCQTESNSASTSRNDIMLSTKMPKKSINRNSHPYGLFDEAGAPSGLTPSSTSSMLSLRDLLQPCTMSVPRPAQTRHSRASSGFSGYAVYTQFRSPPGLTRNSRLSLTSFAPPSRVRPVHQPFESTLPDELALRCGEHVSVLRSFDDGWCVVARDTSRSSSRVSLVSSGTGTTSPNGDHADIGVVPAWVFAEPLEGVACARLFRSTSLNALRSGQNPGYARDTVPSSTNLRHEYVL